LPFTLLIIIASKTQQSF